MKPFWTVGQTGEALSMEGVPAKTAIFSWKGGWFQHEAEKYILFQSSEFSLQLYPCWRHETWIVIYWVEGVINKSCFWGGKVPIPARFSKCMFTNEGKHRYIQAVSTSTAHRYIQQQCPQVLQYFWVESSYPMERWGAWGCWSSWIWPDWADGAGKSCDLLLLCTCSYSQPSNPMCVKRLWVRVHRVWTCTTLTSLCSPCTQFLVTLKFLYVCKVVQRQNTSLLVINCTVVFTPKRCFYTVAWAFGDFLSKPYSASAVECLECRRLFDSVTLESRVSCILNKAK